MIGVRSIRTRLALSTAALVAVAIAAITTAWVREQRAMIYRQQLDEARGLVASLSEAYADEFIDQNWASVSWSFEAVLRDRHDLVYAVVHDHRFDGRIIAASPIDLVDHFLPDLVPRGVTERALVTGPDRTQDTRMLRAVVLRDGTVRGHAGEEVVEVARDVYSSNVDAPVVTIRVGVSIALIDRSSAQVLRTAIGIGAVVLLIGLVAALVIARRTARPIVALRDSAVQLAAGNLAHRARVVGRDEIGQLAGAFNDMSGALEVSFQDLQRVNAQLAATARSFERFVPEKFLRVVAPEGLEKIQVGTSARRTVTVLFSDIRGYTTISEGMDAQQIFELLNLYLDRVGVAIERCGGFIDKYIGDAVMAVFDDLHADTAVTAALEMRIALATWNVERAARGEPPIETGIGLHHGEVVMGTVGFSSRIDSTIIGDTVNVASRVESLTKEYGRAILVTGAVVEALADRTGYTITKVDDAARVKGKTGTLALYAIDAR